ncbi:MAG: ABC transporter permease [Desulfuromonadia bacterium]
MDLFIEGIRTAINLLLGGDREIYEIMLLSLKISCSATVASLLIGIPVGTALALSHFPGRRFIIAVVNTGMGLPPVVAGLLISMLLWRSGPLGALEILYTPFAMVMAQGMIALPIVTGITIAAIQSLPPELRFQILALGATKRQMVMILMREAKLPLLAAVMAAFGGVISEVGASMMVGGNIRGETRVLTTATVMEAGRGNFHTAIALSLILLLLAFGITTILTLIQQRERPR